MKITLIEYPGEMDWIAVKQRALITVGLKLKNPPDRLWEEKILNARHSPIRRLHFAFLLEGIPYWVAMHLRTHAHDCPNGDEFTVYIKSQRDDRQSDYQRGKAPQDQPVDMIIDMSGEQLMAISNKRLCKKTADETRNVVQEMCNQAITFCPEFEEFLVPMCIYHGGVCREMESCGRCSKA